MDDFKALLEKQVKKAAGVVAAPTVGTTTSGKGREVLPRVASAPETKAIPAKVEPVPEVLSSPQEAVTREEPMETSAVSTDQETTPESVASELETGRTGPVSRLGGGNLNRVTVNLFDADRRALAVIKEKLGSQGHDFTNRSDSIKIGLRLAMKASREDLAAVYEQVKAEDRRFRPAP